MKPEEALHLAVARYLDVALVPPAIYTTFPAGGGGRVRGAKLKAAGLKPGWPDLVVMDRAYGMAQAAPVVVGIELKSPTGRQSADQRRVQRQFEALNFPYGICRSVDDVEQLLRRSCVPLRATAGLRMARAA